MSKYKIIDQNAIQFITVTVVDWIDVFIRKTYKDIVIESLAYCQKEKGLIVYAYVIMSSHLHLIVSAKEDFILSDILRDFKKFTAKKILLEIEKSSSESRKDWLLHKFTFRGIAASNTQQQFWQADNHPIELFSTSLIVQKIAYIHENPVKEEWVDSAEHYLYSSASNYTNGEGKLDVEFLELPMSWIGYVGT